MSILITHGQVSDIHPIEETIVKKRGETECVQPIDESPYTETVVKGPSRTPRKPGSKKERQEAARAQQLRNLQEHRMKKVIAARIAQRQAVGSKTAQKSRKVTAQKINKTMDEIMYENTSPPAWEEIKQLAVDCHTLLNNYESIGTTGFTTLAWLSPSDEKHVVLSRSCSVLASDIQKLRDDLHPIVERILQKTGPVTMEELPGYYVDYENLLANQQTAFGACQDSATVISDIVDQLADTKAEVTSNE